MNNDTYGIASMEQAAQNLRKALSEAAEQFQKMDVIANGVADAIKGEQAGVAMSEKIMEKRRELTAIMENIDKLVPILEDTVIELKNSDLQMTQTIQMV